MHDVCSRPPRSFRVFLQAPHLFRHRLVKPPQAMKCLVRCCVRCMHGSAGSRQNETSHARCQRQYRRQNRCCCRHKRHYFHHTRQHRRQKWCCCCHKWHYFHHTRQHDRTTSETGPQVSKGPLWYEAAAPGSTPCPRVSTGQTIALRTRRLGAIVPEGEHCRAKSRATAGCSVSIHVSTAAVNGGTASP